jgi:hypothetical protein
VTSRLPWGIVTSKGRVDLKFSSPLGANMQGLPCKLARQDGTYNLKEAAQVEASGVMYAQVFEMYGVHQYWSYQSQQPHFARPVSARLLECEGLFEVP